MSTSETALIAHLMRRAGFGARYDEIEALADKGYDATVDWLLNPVGEPETDDDITLRFTPMHVEPQGFAGPASRWLYRILNTRRPLEEKMTLFWHCVFATGFSKLNSGTAMWRQYEMLHAHAMGNFRELLLQLSKDPAMIYWLDNCENHADAVNENWGRELLELFSMGVGNYTEVDVRECSRAFTGWTIEPKLPRGPIGRHDWFFEYRPEDHDDTEKTFLGNTGNLNGEDIVRIISENPACARFIARHLYNFFVADEAQVPAWSVTPPNDPEAVDAIANALKDNGYDMRAALRLIFNSDFFKNARFARLKNPTEVVVGTLRMVGGAEFPAPGIGDLSRQPCYMGQDLLNPPSVEGWHTGAEWINSGSLMRRVNFTADLVGDVSRPGIRDMVNRLQASGVSSPSEVVDGCLDLMGPLEIASESRDELVGFVGEAGGFAWGSDAEIADSTRRVSELLQLIVSLREYQYA